MLQDPFQTQRESAVELSEEQWQSLRERGSTLSPDVIGQKMFYLMTECSKGDLEVVTIFENEVEDFLSRHEQIPNSKSWTKIPRFKNK